MYLGIDIGSVAAKVVLLDKANEIIEKYYRRTQGQPVIIFIQILKDIASRYPDLKLEAMAVTGSGGKLISDVTKCDFINEIIAQGVATVSLYPEVKTIVEIGGEDAKLIHVEYDVVNKTPKVVDFSTNTLCSAGTGSFLDQQASRLGLAIEDFSKIVVQSTHPSRVAGRCSVFAKTDMIHLQQTAVPVSDIAAGLCYALARNFRSNVAKGATLVTPIAFQGGVAANKGMIKALQSVFDIQARDFVVPDDFALMGAIGAIQSCLSQDHVDKSTALTEIINTLERYLKERTIDLVALEKLEGDNYPINVDITPIVGDARIEAYLGVDVGSISTNVVVMDKDNHIIARRYLMTAGRPIEAVANGLLEVGKGIGDKVIIKGACSTGSGRYMTGAFFGADAVKNEITCHAKGALWVDPKVDTIFEIGGQDAKYIRLANGTIIDFTMNKACAAGTGSFLEEQAEKLDVKLDQEFGARALASPRPIDLGERCTVFMESQLNYYKQQGLPKDDLLAGLAYSVVRNYLTRVVEDRPIGHHVFFQGGTAYNRSVKAAFEKVVGQKVTVPAHHDILGAVGAALIAKEESMDPPDGEAGKVTRFKGFDLSNRKYTSSSFECQSCPNHCEIRKVIFESEAPLFYGSRCGKYDTAENKQRRANITLPDLFKEREDKLINRNPIIPLPGERKEVIGIPRCLIFFELYPLWHTFFRLLGFQVKLSKPTNQQIIKAGVEHIVNEPCFPIKVAHGHIMDLLKDRPPDYLFLPVQVNLPPLSKVFDRSYNCPYVQGLPFTMESSLGLAKNYPDVKVLKPVFHMDRSRGHLVKILASIAKDLGIKDKKLINDSAQAAIDAQSQFTLWLTYRGEGVLKNLPESQTALVLIGRPYNTCDRGVNIDLPRMLREMGILAIPIDMLPIEPVIPEISKDYPDMYWKSGQRILAAARTIVRDNRLFPVYVTNFGCGPDSYIVKFFDKEMSGKPYLTLEIDEHSSSVGILTRCEAFMDTIRSAARLGNPQPVANPEFIPARADGHIIYVPYMDDHGFILAAAMRAYNIKGEALPASNEESLELGRKHTSGRECFPSIITTGDILKKTRADGFDPDRAAFFMPSAKGPCRFGQYNKLHRMVLDSVGLEKVQIMVFDQTEGYHKDVAKFGNVSFKKLVWRGMYLIDLMQKTLREIRPYEVNPGETNRVYYEGLKELEELLETQGDLERFAHKIRGLFDAVKVDKSKKRPKIGIVGEIYVRSNPFTNNFVVNRLEKLGAQVALPPFEEWLDYIDHIRMQDYKRLRQVKDYVFQKISGWVQESTSKKLRRHFEGAIKDFYEEEPIAKTIDSGQRYIDEAIRGESILSMGRAMEYAEHGFDGILNIIPFGCMPGTVVNALLHQFREDYHLPTITLVVDGLKDPGEDMRLEAFVNQIRGK